MKLVTYSRYGSTHTGIWLDGDRVLDIATAAKAADETIDASSMIRLIQGGEPTLAVLRRLAEHPTEGVLLASEIHLLAPIPRPHKNVFCIGRNYLDHIKEGHRARQTEVKIPEVPQIFTKPPTAVIGPNAEVRYDQKVTTKLDYEIELGVIIGKTGRDIPEDKAFDHVFGYTIINDVTARDLQRRHDQWFKGKGLDTSCPMGPWIIDKDEIGDPTTLELVLTVNGEERQRAHVHQMIFNIPKIIASLSAGLTLEAGDVIATGTPSGVGYAMDPPGLLKGGDLVVCTIDRIGSLANRIVEV